MRSARDQFFRLIRPFQPLYLYVGRSAITQQFMDDTEYGDLAVNGMNVSFAYRDDSRKSQGYPTDATAYTNGDKIQSYIDSHDIDMSRELTSPIFDFVNYNDPARTLSGQDAQSVGIVHSASYRTYFDYDAASGRYLMSQYNSHKGYIEPTADEITGEQTGFENVFVLFTEITTYPYPGGNIDPKTGQDKGDPDSRRSTTTTAGSAFTSTAARPRRSAGRRAAPPMR